MGELSFEVTRTRLTSRRNALDPAVLTAVKKMVP